MQLINLVEKSSDSLNSNNTFEVWMQQQQKIQKKKHTQIAHKSAYIEMVLKGN